MINTLVYPRKDRSREGGPASIGIRAYMLFRCEGRQKVCRSSSEELRREEIEGSA